MIRIRWYLQQASCLGLGATVVAAIGLAITGQTWWLILSSVGLFVTVLCAWPAVVLTVVITVMGKGDRVHQYLELGRRRDGMREMAMLADVLRVIAADDKDDKETDE